MEIREYLEINITKEGDSEEKENFIERNMQIFELGFLLIVIFLVIIITGLKSNQVGQRQRSQIQLLVGMVVMVFTFKGVVRQ